VVFWAVVVVVIPLKRKRLTKVCARGHDNIRTPWHVGRISRHAPQTEGALTGDFERPV